MNRDKIINERAQSNIDEFMEKGPGLRTTTRSWVLRRCPNGHSELGGLGGMGIGVMWFSDHYSDGRVAVHTKDQTYAEAPVETGDAACGVCHPFDWNGLPKIEEDPT